MKKICIFTSFVSKYVARTFYHKYIRFGYKDGYFPEDDNLFLHEPEWDCEKYAINIYMVEDYYLWDITPILDID